MIKYTFLGHDYGSENIVVVKHFCNTLFEKATRHIWLQMVFSNHCMNESGHDCTIHTRIGLPLLFSHLIKQKISPNCLFQQLISDSFSKEIDITPII